MDEPSWEPRCLERIKLRINSQTSMRKLLSPVLYSHQLSLAPCRCRNSRTSSRRGFESNLVNPSRRPPCPKNFLPVKRRDGGSGPFYINCNHPTAMAPPINRFALP